jgi:rRNA maturation RNase YbeY
MSNVFFYNADISLRITNKQNLKLAILELFNKEGYALKQLNYIFCSDTYLLKINQGYLKHNTLTDVITFNLSSKNEPIQGEIYISIERVKSNAKLYQVSMQNELSRVMIHGALHLCGYDDKTKRAKEEMRTREDYYLNNLSFT